MNIFYLSILFPLLSFLLLVFFKNYFSKKWSTFIGVSSIGLSSIIALYCAVDFFKNNQKVFTKVLWHWIKIDTFNIDFGFFIDDLTLSMFLIVTIIGFFIHIFAIWYMQDSSDYCRFFAYTNLFIFNMLILVLADNLLLMYLGWEGVGFCSYLLIGFYYKVKKNITAAMKAFIITRISDIFLVFALFIFWNELHTLNFQKMSILSATHFENNHYILNFAALMLLLGAIGKSAQLPLHTWLVDAMVGPTPVSALIHAATMVTAGVYLIARNKHIFLLTPNILYLIEAIGVVTMITAGCAALFQSNIKRILAYSTMSQIGYMFIALGAQAWSTAINHLMTHAFFKALLFLSAGSIIIFCHKEQNIFFMRGLRKQLPLVYICFLIGSLSLASIPWITSGFFSKEEILVTLLSSKHFLVLFFSLLGVFITTLYTFRMIFILFYGEKKITIMKKKTGLAHNVPLIFLLICSTVIGTLAIQCIRNHIYETITLPYMYTVMLKIFSIGIILIGFLIAKKIWLKNYTNKKIKNTYLKHIIYWWCSTNGFNWYYEKIFVNMYTSIIKVLKSDPLSTFLIYVTKAVILHINKIFLITQNGFLRWYINYMIFGASIILIIVLKIKNI